MRIWPAVMVAVVLAGCGGSPGPRIESPDGEDAVGKSATPGGWSELPPSPLGPRHSATAVWVDGSLLVFAGRDTSPCPPGADCSLPQEAPLADGARFNPSDGSWTSIAPVPLEVESASTAVLGGSVYLWATTRAGDSFGSAFIAYDVHDDRWTPLPMPPESDGLVYADLEATDTDIVLVQGSHEHGRRPDLRYRPQLQTFAELPPDPIGPSFDRDMTFTDDVLVLTGIDITASPGGADGPARYRAATWTEKDGWIELPTGHVVGYDPEWLAADGKLINPSAGQTNGGETNTYDRFHPFGGILDPHTGIWSDLPQGPEAAAGDGLRLDRSIGDSHLMINALGIGFRPDLSEWVTVGVPDSGPTERAAAVVGNGQLYIFGGVDWTSPGEDAVIDKGWIFTPDS